MTIHHTSKTKSMVYIAMFTIIIAVCSWITIPFVVPVTLQTFGVFLAMAVLGGKRGSIAVSMYILIGLAGVPVFSGFQGGPGILLGVTGGYIVGFLFSALSMWAIEALFGRGIPVFFISMTVGLFICYLFGTIWYIWVYAGSVGNASLAAALLQCVIPFVIPDMIKIIFVLLLRKRLRKIMKNMNA